MNAVVKATSPLESAVQQIKDNPQYLNGQHARALFDILKKMFGSMLDEKKDEKDILAAQLRRMGETIEKLANQAIGGETTDIKRVVDAQMQYFKLLAKFNDALVANERMMAIESATIEALQELGNKTVHDRFLTIFERKLEEKSQK